MIQTRGANIHKWHDLFPEAMLQRVLIHGGVHASESIWNLDAKVFRKCNTHHTIASIDLVAQTDYFDPAMPIDRVTNTDHRIREIDKPGVRASLLHVACDLQDGTDVARGVREAARSTVF